MKKVLFMHVFVLSMLLMAGCGSGGQVERPSENETDQEENREMTMIVQVNDSRFTASLEKNAAARTDR